MESFDPPFYLRGSHQQTLLSSNGPRNLWLQRHCRALLNSETRLELQTECGATLLCYANAARHSSSKKALIVIHGWEGSSHSGYVLSMAMQAWLCGMSVFRLNMRDHGDSHHLNVELFRSTRIQEVAEAVQLLQQQNPEFEFSLCGFSLGGNFAIRLATISNSIQSYLAVCPVIKPEKTLQIMEQKQKLYHGYFVRKWKRSLRKKLQYFPNIAGSETLLKANSLAEMHWHFVEHHTPDNTPSEYFRNYEISAATLKNVHRPLHIVTSRDDPIIPAIDFDDLNSHGAEENPFVKINILQHGGHCGFIDSLFAPGWLERNLLHLI